MMATTCRSALWPVVLTAVTVVPSVEAVGLEHGDRVRAEIVE